MWHLTLPPTAVGGMIALLFMTHAGCYIAGLGRRDR
jgi:hypothetical protein